MEETLNYCIHGTQAYVKLPYSQNAVTRHGLINLFLDIGKVCLCDTNCRLSHKDPCPKWGIKSLRSRD